jgi:hypothetical protein
MKDPQRPGGPPKTPGVPTPAAEPEHPGWRRIPLPARRIPRQTRSSPDPAPVTGRRQARRLAGAFRIDYATIDAVTDPSTGEACFHSGEHELTVNLSRRGLCLVCTVPPEPGTRLLLQVWVPDEARPIELVGRTCWTRVEFRPGLHGARPVSAVGIELLGGSGRALDRYDRAFARLERESGSSVAGPLGLG